MHGKHQPDIAESILTALRRVIRAVDQHSRSLVNSHGLTGPQALLLSEVVRQHRITGSELAEKMSLSQATITDVVKRLESRGLLNKARSTEDRRRILVEATEEGRALVAQSVPLLQERFVERLDQLERAEQFQLLEALQRIAAMMNAEDLDASPVLASGAINASVDAVQEVLEADGQLELDVGEQVATLQAAETVSISG